MQGATYAAAGVDIAAADRTLSLIKPAVRATHTADVVNDIGNFGGLFALDLARWKKPVLVSSVDSVGTKVMIAAAAGRHRNVGFDMVHHSVNDIAVMGALPLFFLDYYATAHLSPEVASEVIVGLADACREVGCALVGGELAELPGMYNEGHYDLVGCIVGCVERDGAMTRAEVRPGDALLALPSSGLHTNGYSLARKVLLADHKLPLDADPGELGCTLADALLAPHTCYLEPIQTLRQAGLLHAAAHITGGGLFDNLPRVLPADCGATVTRGTWPEPPIFGLIARLGEVPEDLFKTFNMGMGMILVVPQSGVDDAQARLQAIGRASYRVGEVTQGTHEATLQNR